MDNSIVNQIISENFPAPFGVCSIEAAQPYLNCRAKSRITIAHRNIPNSLSQFTTVMAGENINIAGLMNKSRGEYAYTILDLDHAPSPAAVEKLKNINGVIRVRVIC